MTEIYAVIRRQRAKATQEELKRAGCVGYTRFPVLGRGRQGGVRSANGATSASHSFLPRMLFYLVVEDEQTQEIVEAIIRANQTGEFGDGRIFISKIGATHRLSDAQSETPATPVRL